MDEHLTQLQGKWRVTALHENGVDVPKAKFGSSSITIANTRFTAAGPGTFHEGDMTIDPRAQPKRLTVVMSGPHGLRTNNAIYEVNGDTLRICLNGTSGGAHPKAFATQHGDGCAMMTYARER